MLDKMKETMGMKEPKEQTLLGDLEDSITLTKMQRLYGFAFCFGLGVFLSFMVRHGTALEQLVLNNMPPRIPFLPLKHLSYFSLRSSCFPFQG